MDSVWRSRGIAYRTLDEEHHDSDPSPLGLPVSTTTKTGNRKSNPGSLFFMSDEEEPTSAASLAAVNNNNNTNNRQQEQIQATVNTHRRPQLMTLADVRDREQEMLAMENDVMTVQQVYQNLSHLVYEQGTFVDSIEANIEQAHEQVITTEKTVVKAVAYKRKYQKKQLICSLLSAILGFALVVYILFQISPHLSSSGSDQTPLAAPVGVEEKDSAVSTIQSTTNNQTTNLIQSNQTSSSNSSSNNSTPKRKPIRSSHLLAANRY